MSSAAQRAREELQRDFVLQEALARGIINVKGAARYLKEHYGLEGSEDAISQGIYNLEHEDGSKVISEAFRVLSRCMVKSRVGLAALVIERNGHTGQRLSRLLGRVSVASQEVLRFVPDDDRIVIVVEASKLADARSVFDEATTHEFIEELAEIRVKPPEGEERTPGLLAVCLTMLALRGIEPRFPMSGHSEHFIPVLSEKVEEGAELFKQV